MEVGPTCHYVMGGIAVDPDTGQSRVPGLFAAGECAGGMHGSNRLGGNSLSDLLVFGRRAGLGAADYVVGLERRPAVRDDDVELAAAMTLAPFEAHPAGLAGENPYTLHAELQRVMNDLVGIIRTEQEMVAALDRLAELRARVHDVVVEGHRQYNPGWHLALDLRNMLMVSEAVASSALLRTESRGGHTREDYPGLDATWRHRVLVTHCVRSGSGLGAGAGAGAAVVPRTAVEPAEREPMRPDLLALFDLTELEKYYTPAELAGHPDARHPDAGHPNVGRAAAPQPEGGTA